MKRQFELPTKTTTSYWRRMFNLGFRLGVYSREFPDYKLDDVHTHNHDLYSVHLFILRKAFKLGQKYSDANDRTKDFLFNKLVIAAMKYDHKQVVKAFMVVEQMKNLTRSLKVI